MKLILLNLIIILLRTVYMFDIIDFLNTNKDWLFSGAGTEVIVGIFTVIGGIIYWLLKKGNAEPNLIQQSIGNNSSDNNQAGHDIKINESDIGEKRNV